MPGSRDLRIATFNAENFYLLLDRQYSYEDFLALSDEQIQGMNWSFSNPNKLKDQLEGAARLIRQGNYDLVGMVEVGGLETLRNFNRYYLDEAFDCYLHEENSRRGIFVGALVRKGRFGLVEARNASRNFSRNLLDLRLYSPQGGLRVLVVHLKSHYGMENGIEIRRREVQQLCDLLPPKGCIVMGDFNGIAIPGRHQFEFDPLLALPYRDVLEAIGMPEDERQTHYYFTPEPHFNQLDYMFCSHDIQVLDARIVTPFVPSTRDERQWLPSDHALLEATVRRAGRK